VRVVFADTGYWIAVSNPRDSLHAQARELSRALRPVHIVTSEMVLTEYLNDFSRRGEFLRRASTTLTEQLRNNPNATIVPQTTAQFWAAVSFYAARGDKTWSLTDCASLRLMQQYGLREALTHDRNFEQAGFKALLRDEG
jgi:predicted nucleic acid-binding protein